MKPDSASAAYWHERYIQTSQKAQDYVAKLGADIERLEEILECQTARIVDLQDEIRNLKGQA